MPQPLVEHEDYYWQGNRVVLTESYHRNRGWCCGMGCQHCPYQFEAVPEPKRTELLLAREKAKNS